MRAGWICIDDMQRNVRPPASESNLQMCSRTDLGYCRTQYGTQVVSQLHSDPVLPHPTLRGWKLFQHELFRIELTTVPASAVSEDANWACLDCSRENAN